MTPGRVTLGLVAGAALILALAFARRPSVPAPPSPPSTSKRGRATVTVYDDGHPFVGRWVVFHDAEGSVLSSAKSGPDGKASGEIDDGAMITVAYGNSVRQLVTVTGVAPGDELVIGESEDEGGAAKVLGTSRVVLPGAHGKASRYTVSLGVGSTEAEVGRPAPMPVLERFVTEGGKFRVLAEAEDAKGEPLAFAFAWGKLEADGGAGVDVRLPAWSADYRPFALVLTNASRDVAAVQAELAVLAEDGDRFDRKRRQSVSSGGASVGAIELRFPVPRPLGEEIAYQVEVTYASAPDKAVIARRGRLTSTEIDVDLGATLLPRVSKATIERTTGGGRPWVRWEVVGDASKADAVIARVAWPETAEHVWTLVASPRDTRRVQLPALPEELAEWRPDARPTAVGVALVESSFYDGYDDVRRKGIALIAEAPDDEREWSTRYTLTGDIHF